MPSTNRSFHVSPLVLAASVAFVAHGVHGAEVVLPALAAHVEGANGSIWGSEIRVTNFSTSSRTLQIVDWIGTPGWMPSVFIIPPAATRSISAWTIYAGSREGLPFSNPFGAAVAEVDDGLLVQTAILTGNPRGMFGTVGDLARCSEWTGGWLYQVGGILDPDGTLTNQDGCDEGAGPIIDDSATSFFDAGASILLPWLHTDPTRRVNLSFVNPDSSSAIVTISMFPADGSSPVVSSMSVPAHAVSQLNDVFASGDFSPIRARNASLSAAAARATIVSTTRLYPLAYVISNQNNTVSLALPRLAP